MTKKARIAVVGTGWWATVTHIPGLLANDSAELVALCDNDPAKLQQTAQAWDVDRTYTDVRDMLETEELDGAIVATNHASHYTVAKACLERGLHLLIEKPMTLFASEARELLELARSQGVEISIGYNHVYKPYTIWAQTVMRSGVLGEVQYISGIFNQHIIDLLSGKGAPRATDKVHSPGAVYSDPVRSGGGHGHLQITHLAGMLFFITGLRVQKVHALMGTHGLAVDLVDAINVQFANGGLAAIGGTGNLGIPERKIDLQIYCERGFIDIDDVVGTARIRGQNFEPEDHALSADDRQQHPRFATTDNLVDVILGLAENGASGEVGWRVVELLDAAYRSAAQDGAGVKIEELYDNG